MDSLAQREKEKYETLWSSFPEYREASAADLLTPAFLDFFKREVKKGDVVIDFGCGAGRSAPFLLKAGLKVQLVDFCDSCLDSEIFLQTIGPKSALRFFQECLWDLSSHVGPADWILCFDVLEHLPEEKVDAVLHNMASRMKKGGLISISTREDHHGSSIGERLHLTVKPASWWREKAARHFSILRELADDDECLVWALSAL